MSVGRELSTDELAAGESTPLWIVLGLVGAVGLVGYGVVVWLAMRERFRNG
jgi:hypothetical protein